MTFTEQTREYATQLGLTAPENLYGMHLYTWLMQQVGILLKRPVTPSEPVKVTSPRRDTGRLKPACKRGHAFTEANTRWLQQPKSGQWYRQCQECLALRSAGLLDHENPTSPSTPASMSRVERTQVDREVPGPLSGLCQGQLEFLNSDIRKLPRPQ